MLAPACALAAPLCDPSAPIPAEPKALQAVVAETERCKEAFDKRLQLLADLFPELGLKPAPSQTAVAPPPRPAPRLRQPEPERPLANTDAIRGATVVPPGPSGSPCYVGPRGGTYTITSSGKKNYSGC